MDNWIFDFALSVILTAIKSAVKNEHKKAEIKRALMKIRDAIIALYPEDTLP